MNSHHRRALLALLLAFLSTARAARAGDRGPTVDIPADALEDKIRGGLLGQILGNLNGLPHEMRYIHEPGDVRQYTPALPDGARTDDDTDIEWVYLTEMRRSGELFLPPARIRELWRTHINHHVWCANAYSRHLFDLGLEPPLTGRLAVNPWANFNISGSFLCESFALCAPGMPRSAAELALHYTHVAIDGEPAQSTQFVTAMIATAFFEDDVEKVLDAGLAAVDARSVIRANAADVRGWVKQHPDDWRATRRLVRDAYTRFGGDAMPDKNGVHLNTAATVAALLYGRGDFAETLRLAFNFGWDADNNAATCGTIVGVVKGKRWMDAQGWDVRDVYRNTTRDGMPQDETITGFGDLIVDAARRLIPHNGGQELTINGKRVFRIRVQAPANVEPLPDPDRQAAELREQLRQRLEAGLSAEAPADRAGAAYLAICLGEWERLRDERPGEWSAALDALRESGSSTVRDLFDAPPPAGPAFREWAEAAGLRKPPERTEGR